MVLSIGAVLLRDEHSSAAKALRIRFALVMALPILDLPRRFTYRSFHTGIVAFMSKVCESNMLHLLHSNTQL